MSLLTKAAERAAGMAGAEGTPHAASTAPRASRRARVVRAAGVLLVACAWIPGGLRALPGPQDATDMPGWLAFAAVRPESSHVRPWTPGHAAANVVVMMEDLDGLKPGHDYSGATADGVLQLRFVGQTLEPYGCDRTMTLMVGLAAPHRLAEGPVWVLPAEAARQLAPRSVAVVQRTATPTARTWTAGPLTFDLQRTDATVARWRIRHGPQVVSDETVEKPYMDGADRRRLDLSKDREIGMPVPIAVYAITGKRFVAFFESTSYEGFRFFARLVDARRASETGGSRLNGYVYFCAF